MLEDLDLHHIADDRARELVRQLLNLLEDVSADLRAAQAEIQLLRNEINRLKGEQGQPTIKPNTLALTLYFGGQMSEPKVAELLRSGGVQIFDGQVSNLLIKDQAAFHAEKAALYQTGLARSPRQPLDDTSTRVNGHNGYCHVVCNPLYTAYFTTSTKDRLTSIDVLTNYRPRRFVVNAEALGDVEASGLSAARCRQLAQVPSEVTMDEAQMQALLETYLPGLGP